MIILKKNKNISKDCYKEVVSVYLAYVETYLIDMKEQAIAELLRCTVCKCLDLESKAYDKSIERFADDCKVILKPIFRKYGCLDKSVDYKRGMLEACMHCIEFSRKRI